MLNCPGLVNKLDGIIKSQKDVFPHGSKKNVVCKIYNALYVEQTGRKLELLEKNENY